MWQLWEQGSTLNEVLGIEPRLASWEKHDNPAQVRLREYLQDLLARIGPLSNDGPLSLDMTVDVGDPARLLHHYDLENYLTPLFGKKWLPSSRFVLVSARKTVGGGSSLRISRVEHRQTAESSSGWHHISVQVGSGTQTKEWKQRLHDTLVAEKAARLPDGPVEVRLAWRCASRRNWVQLWKPTGDAMGPVLGYVNSTIPFHPNDDRIVRLELHLELDEQAGNDVEVGMWWRHADGLQTSFEGQELESETSEQFEVDPNNWTGE